MRAEAAVLEDSSSLGNFSRYFQPALPLRIETSHLCRAAFRSTDLAPLPTPAEGSQMMARAPHTRLWRGQTRTADPPSLGDRKAEERPPAQGPVRPNRLQNLRGGRVAGFKCIKVRQRHRWSRLAPRRFYNDARGAMMTRCLQLTHAESSIHTRLSAVASSTARLGRYG